MNTEKTTETTETQQVPVSQHAKPVDTDAIRETVESGEVTKHRAEDQLLELCDEVEYLRKSYAALEADWEASDAEVARLTAAENPDEVEQLRNETPGRVLLREILELLDLPRPAHYDDRDVRRDLLEGRVAFVSGYVNSALDHGELPRGLAEVVAESMPMTYAVKGGES